VLRFVDDALPRVDACILSDYAKGLVSHGLAQGVIRRAAAQGKPVLVDPKGPDGWKYRGATLFKPNLQEAESFLRRDVSSLDDVVAAGRLLLDLLGGSVLLTRGTAGMSLFEPNAEPVHIPTQAREVYDVTG